MDNGREYTLAVVIPCWNCESYIGAMLDCLLNQTFSDWRAFLIDDGCTDKTADVIRSYAVKDGRIIYYMRDRGPKGAPTCRNIGFDLSKGAEYLVFLDGDDLVAPYCFEQRVRNIEREEKADFLSFPAKAFSSDPYDELRWGFGIKGHQDVLLSLLNWRTLSIVVNTNIYRRSSLVDKEMVWDERLLSMQDADFNIQAICKGLNQGFAEGSQIDLFYRIVSDSVSKKINVREHKESHLYLVEKEINSIRTVYGKQFDFYLKAYIVVFFELFQKEKWPYKQLLKQPFVKSQPFFALRLLVYIVLGLRGKRRLFKAYCRYNEKSIKDWNACVADKIKELVAQS